MSAVIKRIPRDQRLRVTAVWDHRTVEYNGDIFQFLEELVRQQWTGRGEFSANCGGIYGLKFDFREKRKEGETDIRIAAPQDADTLPAKNALDIAMDSP